MRHRLTDLPLVECSAGSIDARGLDLSKRSIEFVASTASLDSHGTIVEQDWDLSRYTRNPVVLFEHGRAVGGFFSGSGERDIDKLPIARSEKVRVEDGALRMRVVFPAEGRDERSDAVWRAIEDGRLNAVSVGFMPGAMTEETLDTGEKNEDGTPKTRTVTRISKNTLYELSVVGLPSNADAVAVRALSVRHAAARALRPLAALPPEEGDGPLSVRGSPDPAAFVQAFVEHPAVAGALRSLSESAAAKPKPEAPADEAGPESAPESAPESVEDPNAKPAKKKKTPAAKVANPSEEHDMTPEQIAALTAERDAAVTSLASFRDLLDLPEGADAVAVTKAVAALSTAAAENKDRDEKLAAATKSLDEALTREATRECDWIVRSGDRGLYGLGKGQNRKALLALRALDRADFDATYQVALDGLKAHDEPAFFTTKAVTPDPDEVQSPTGGAETDLEDGVSDIESRASKYAAKQLAAGRPTSMADAIDAVARGLDRK